MGGLMNDFKSKSYTKVPILGDIPILGLAFRQDGKKRQKQNLLIFITPTILRDTDFKQYERTDFLQTPTTNTLGGTESAWDSGRPHDWKKKSRKNQ
jgi:general secretion pathway protein D